MRVRLFAMLPALLFAGVLLPSSVYAQAPSYHLTVLGSVGANGINDNGEVVGSFFSNSTGTSDACVWNDGTITDLPISDSVGAGINDAGQIAGYATIDNNTIEAFEYSNGTVEWLGFLPDASILDSQATGINASGDVVGYSYKGDYFHAFLYKAGVMTDLGVPTGSTASIGRSINDSDDIVGYGENPNIAFLYHNGQMTTLGALTTYGNSVATCINDEGQIVGESYASDGYNDLFLYQNGTMTDLGGPPNSIYTQGQSINNYGVIVGWYEINAQELYHCFLYLNGQFYDLNSILDSSGSGYTIYNVFGINDSGQIAAVASFDYGDYSVLLTPNTPLITPTPTALSPTSAAALTGFTLTVLGTDFAPGDVVDWNGAPLSTKYVSSKKLTATVTPAINSALASNTYPGAANITVSWAGGQSVSALPFTIAVPRPTLSSISPASGIAGRSDMTLTLNGKGFASGAVAEWNGTSLSTEFLSNTKLTADVPAAMLTTPGTYSVQVFNPDKATGSVSHSFVVKVTTIGLKVGTPTRDPNTQAITLPITLVNTGHDPAPALTISAATLGSAATSSVLPDNLGTLNAGKSVTAKLVFPASAGSSGSSVTFSISGTYTGGSFSATKTMTLP